MLSLTPVFDSYITNICSLMSPILLRISRPRLADMIHRLEQQLPAQLVTLQKCKALAAARAAHKDLLNKAPSTSASAKVGDHKIQGLLSLSLSKIADGEGLLVRFVAGSTDAAYAFLREHLEPLSPQLGSRPFAA